MKVKMKNPITGELKEVKIGWSWTIFFLSGFFGIIFFLRKLNIWGGIFLALSVAMLFTTAQPEITLYLTLIFWVLIIWLSVKGNEMTAKNYLELGWEFSDTDDSVEFAKGKWGIVKESKNG